MAPSHYLALPFRSVDTARFRHSLGKRRRLTLYNWYTWIISKSSRYLAKHRAVPGSWRHDAAVHVDEGVRVARETVPRRLYPRAHVAACVPHQAEDAPGVTAQEAAPASRCGASPRQRGTWTLSWNPAIRMFRWQFLHLHFLYVFQHNIIFLVPLMFDSISVNNNYCL